MWTENKGRFSHIANGAHQMARRGYPKVAGFRVTSIEKAAIETAARAAGLPTSEFLRGLIVPAVVERMGKVAADTIRVEREQRLAKTA